MVWEGVRILEYPIWYDIGVWMSWLRRYRKLDLLCWTWDWVEAGHGKFGTHLGMMSRPGYSLVSCNLSWSIISMDGKAIDII